MRILVSYYYHLRNGWHIHVKKLYPYLALVWPFSATVSHRNDYFVFYLHGGNTGVHFGTAINGILLNNLVNYFLHLLSMVDKHSCQRNHGFDISQLVFWYTDKDFSFESFSVVR